ncbi:MAG: N-acetylmuramoyl-L-alanine amidase [Pontixanthobacter sp.]
MSPRLQILVLLLLPIALVGTLFALGWTLPVPHLGRDYVIRLTIPDADAPVDLPEVLGPQDRSRPLVVIDAGHGGDDPGASGNGYLEKAVVLGLAEALRDELLEGGGIRVAMTRSTDEYLSLLDRPEIARRLKADLFISVHADSSGDLADVSGASVYTLSREASSQAAALFAKRENSDNALNGLNIDSDNQQVNEILVELSQRRVQEQSAQFAQLVLREGRGTLVFHPEALRSATLAVLRAPDVPAILYEAGFITNMDDAERLTSDEGQQRFSEVMARAIRIHFARQSN